MRKVLTAAHPEAHMVRGLLESEGIEAVVRGEGLNPSVWVLDPADAEAAESLIAGTSAGATAGARKDRSWRCRNCNEFVGPEFIACWQCGAGEPICT
jgi:hypothetical protein